MQERSHIGLPYIILGLTFCLSTMLAPFLWRGEEDRARKIEPFPQRPKQAATEVAGGGKKLRGPAVASKPSPRKQPAGEDVVDETPEEPVASSEVVGPPLPPEIPARDTRQQLVALNSTAGGSTSGASSAETSVPAPRAAGSASDAAPSATPLSPADEPSEPTLPPVIVAEESTRGRVWPVAESLEQQLTSLADQVPLSKSWVERVVAELNHVSRLPALKHPDVAQHLNRLERLTADARQQACQPDRAEGRSRVLRACYALDRRVGLWKVVHALENQGSVSPAPLVSRNQIEATLKAVSLVLKQNPEEAGWNRYLMLAEAGKTLPQFAEQAEAVQRLAREMLRRIHSPQLEVRQELLLNQPAVQNLEKLLRQIAQQPIDRVALLASIEKYESLPQSQEAASVADLYERLRWSASGADVELANRVGAFYRNANVRVALTEELVNRMLPKDQWSRDPVQDNIMGADIQGESSTHARVRMTLVPDDKRWRLGVVADGQVTSATASSKGPATFYQDGYSQFHARKMLLIDRSGVRLYRTETSASANTELRDYETGFDNIPLFGAIARAVVRNAYEEQSAWAQGEVEDRIANQASSRLDEEVRKQVEQAQKDVYAQLIDPLNELRLNPTPVEFETTTERLIARYRVAGTEQLAAYTPRPQAPAGSLFSVQLHQTALNNLLDHLNLNGRRTEIRELHAELSKQFKVKDATVPEDWPEGVIVQFADRDAMRLDCVDGRVRVTVRFAELSQGSRKWKNFAVRAYYKPTADQLNANLVRDGVIELPEGKLTTGDGIALRGVFSKVLSKNRPFNLINDRIAKSPAMKDLKVSQFVVDDGWMAIAVGKPQDQATAQARRPAQR